MKYTYRVVNFSNSPDEAPEPHTWVQVELSKIDGNEVCAVMGTTHVSLNQRFTEFNVEMRAAIEQRLYERGLIDPPTQTVLEEAQRAKLRDMIAKRDSLEVSGFPYMGKTFDSDSLSVMRILTTAMAAVVAVIQNQPMEITWVTADNSTIALDRNGILGLPVALATHANNLHLMGRDMREQIEQAAPLAQVAAVKWPEGSA